MVYMTVHISTEAIYWVSHCGGVPPVKNGTCNLRGNTVGPTLIAIYSKTYRNISTTQTILDTPDNSLYTDNHITDVGVIGRKWQKLKKKRILPIS